ncbi:MAG: hypothetical protein GEU89_00810 [Kiloniellaceae bacterium]|nr:hypothetical protein [Kiloniellaceae bacterium]
MALNIETFSNAKGGNAFFKAIGHPLAARQAAKLLGELAGGSVAIYDPLGYARAFAEIYDIGGLDIAAVYVQDLEDIGEILRHQAQPVTDLPGCKAKKVFVTAFDAERLIAHIGHLLPSGAEVVSLDALRLPEAMLTNRRNYLDSLNFATNLVLFRDGAGLHTRLATANYWSTYGATAPAAWCCLMDQGGRPLAEWSDPLPGAGASVVIDSQQVRQRFGLDDFTGSLFLHVCGVAGHDIVKYALDIYGDSDGDEALSCTHDANSWPADLYAGLPAPRNNEQVLLWVQNSHPAPMPAGSVGLNLMGEDAIAWLEREIPPFGTLAIDTAELLPKARWPQQIEVQAGKHFVRPRYEVITNGVDTPPRRRIAHANVERVDLKPDPRIPELANLLGKGFILPAPILPRGRFRSLALPTPMSTCQANLPLALYAYDPDGREIGGRALGKLPRNHATLVDVAELLNGGEADWGHMELVYDFAEGGEADGWLHGLFRYEDKASGHIAETSFGAHIFNAVLTYKGEPQSYAGRAPGLSTRLFLSFGPAPYAALCHLIYPASTPWHAESQTTLILHDSNGEALAEHEVRIACGGSLLWTPTDYFSAADMKAAGPEGYVIIRDTTCRLFGYHGLTHGEKAFSFDHMFGF